MNERAFTRTMSNNATQHATAQRDRLEKMIATYLHQGQPIAEIQALFPRLQKNQPISTQRPAYSQARPSYPQARPSPVAGNPGSDAMQRHRPGVFYVEGLYKP